MLSNYLLAKYRFNHWTKKDIEEYQNKKFNDIVQYAIDNSPWYKGFYENSDRDAVWELPVTNKQLLIDTFTTTNTIGLVKEDVFKFVEEIEARRDFTKRYHGLNIGMSSGTSGNRGLEVVPPDEEDLLRAIFFARFPYDFLFGRRIKLAFVLRVSAPAFKLDFLGHKLRYISLGEPWQNIVHQLEMLNPNAISAPPSFLLRVAQQVKQGSLKIAPKTIISYAEPLYPEVREYLKEVFEVAIIHEIYKATEGAFANSCKYGTLHWNEDLVAVQLYDEHGQEITYNQPSHQTVITNLYKKATPFIRYELNDIIEFSDTPCKCGSNFRVVKQIQGRCDDILVGISQKDTSRIEYLYPDYFRRAIIGFNSNIIDYQVIQKNTDTIIVRYQSDTSVDEEGLKRALAAVFVQYDCKKPTITIVNEKPIPHPKSLKLCRVIRECDIDIAHA